MCLPIYDADEKLHQRIMLTPWWSDTDKVVASVKLSYHKNIFLVTYSVQEPQLRRMCTHFNDEVYKDSCVEVFLQKTGCQEYMNFEFSASGFCHVAKGTSREGRESLPKKLLEAIPVEVKVLENNTERSLWTLSVQLDLCKFGLLLENEKLQGKTILGNFFCCGDGLAEPHYLSYAQIDTLKPDFHVPSSFVPLEFV